MSTAVGFDEASVYAQIPLTELSIGKSVKGINQFALNLHADGGSHKWQATAMEMTIVGQILELVIS